MLSNNISDIPPSPGQEVIVFVRDVMRCASCRPAAEVYLLSAAGAALRQGYYITADFTDGGSGGGVKNAGIRTAYVNSTLTSEHTLG